VNDDRLTSSGRFEMVVDTLGEVIGKGSGRVALCLTAVRLVNRDGVGHLAVSETNGAERRNCAAYIREWIAREKDVCHG
jgi:hypothetical protein